MSMAGQDLEQRLDGLRLQMACLRYQADCARRLGAGDLPPSGKELAALLGGFTPAELDAYMKGLTGLAAQERGR